MKTDHPSAQSIPGISDSVSILVKEEAIRWREAASANHWEVLDPPVRGTPQLPSTAISSALRARARAQDPSRRPAITLAMRS